MRTLPPQFLREADWADMEAQLLKIFREVLFDPFIGLLRDEKKKNFELKNDRFDELRKAIGRGRITYADGVFRGRFSAAISVAIRAFGGKLNKRTGEYKAKTMDVPGWVRSAAAEYTQRVRKLNESIAERLKEIEKNLPQELGVRSVDALPTVKSVNKGFRAVAKTLTVTPTLTDEGAKALAKGYSDNMDLYVKKWTEDEIRVLRGIVEENAVEGYRADRLVDKIQRRFGVNVRKAHFLARQETGLFMSKFRKERFSDVGVKRYRWRTAGDVKVRHEPGGPDHRRLNGRIFFYDDPPVVDESTGARANPGEDYNCRCVDEPILDPVAAEAVTN